MDALVQAEQQTAIVLRGPQCSQQVQPDPDGLRPLTFRGWFTGSRGESHLGLFNSRIEREIS